MNKLNLFLHLFGQAVAQTAVLAVIPEPAKPYVQAVAVIVGLYLAYMDEQGGKLAQ